jgi:hypothetical protein
MHGTPVSEIAGLLRETYGHAYRRADLLADVRRYRASVEDVAASTYRDVRQLIARAGVAAFAFALLFPTVVSGASPRGADVLVASSIDTGIADIVAEQIALPNARFVTATPAPTPVPTPDPTPVPTATPYRAATVPGGPAVVVTASWYGPGFFENRLPCWQWLQANGLPIQFLPDTWGVAHKTLPCGTMLTLTHGANTITVPVVDRGPYVAGREIDLSPRVKAALGCTDLCSVVMQIH